MPRRHVTAAEEQILARLEAEGRRWLMDQGAYTPAERRATLHAAEDARADSLEREEAEWAQPWRPTHRLRATLTDGRTEDVHVWFRAHPCVTLSSHSRRWIAFRAEDWAARTYAYSYVEQLSQGRVQSAAWHHGGVDADTATALAVTCERLTGPP